MCKIILIIILLFPTLLIDAQEDNIEIVWKSPTTNNFTTSSKDFNIQACINSGDKVNEIALYINNKLEKKIEFNSEIEFRGECDLLVNENIELTNGKNEIKIFAKSNNYLLERTIIVNYEFISADYYALIIGINEYDDDNISDLLQPVIDATNLKDVLINNYSFEAKNIKFMENPSKSEIIGALHKMRSYINEQDNLLIFYAGHGYWDDGMNTGYWFPSDSEKGNPVNWLPNTVLTSYLSAIKTKHTLLIADACFSGGIFKTRKAFNTDQVIERLYQLPSRKAMTSGTLKEVPDQSVFIKYLLKRLNENNEKYLSSEQLFSNMRKAILSNTSNIPQFGTIQNTGDEGGDFIFIKKQNITDDISEETIVKSINSESHAKETLVDAKTDKETVKSVNETNNEIVVKNDNKTTEISVEDFEYDILKTIEPLNQQNIATIYKGKTTNINNVKIGKKYFVFIPSNKKLKQKEQFIGNIIISNIDDKKIAGKYIADNSDNAIDKEVILRRYLPKDKGLHHIIRLNTLQINPNNKVTTITDNNGNPIGEIKLYTMSAFTGFEIINGYMFSPRVFFGFGTGFNNEYHQPFSDAKISNIPLFVNFKLGITKQQLLSINISAGTNKVLKSSNNLRPYTINGQLYYSAGIEFKNYISNVGAFTIGLDYEVKNYKFENYFRYNNTSLSFTKLKIGFEPNFAIF